MRLIYLHATHLTFTVLGTTKRRLYASTNALSLRRARCMRRASYANSRHGSICTTPPSASNLNSPQSPASAMHSSLVDLLHNTRPSATSPKGPDSRTAYRARPHLPSMSRAMKRAELATATIDPPTDHSFRTTLPGHEHLRTGNNLTRKIQVPIISSSPPSISTIYSLSTPLFYSVDIFYKYC